MRSDRFGGHVAGICGSPIRPIPSLLAWTPGKARGPATHGQSSIGHPGDSARRPRCGPSSHTGHLPPPSPPADLLQGSHHRRVDVDKGVTTPESGARFEKARTGGRVGRARLPDLSERTRRSGALPPRICGIPSPLWPGAKASGLQVESQDALDWGVHAETQGSRGGGPADGLDHDSCLSLPTPDHALGSRSGRGHRHIGGITSMKAARP